MKKIYTAPRTFVVKINAEQMICQSMQINSSRKVDVSSQQAGGGFMLDKEDFDSSDDLW